MISKNAHDIGSSFHAAGSARSTRRESGVVQSKTWPVLGPLKVRSISAGAPSAKRRSVLEPSTGCLTLQYGRSVRPSVRGRATWDGG